MHRIIYELEATHGSHPGLAPDSFLVFACEYSAAEMETPSPKRARWRVEYWDGEKWSCGAMATNNRLAVYYWAELPFNPC